MQTYNWSEFKLRIPVKADKEMLYRMWTTQEGIESWFLRKSSFVKPDGAAVPPGAMIEAKDKYEWLWYGYSDDVAEKGTILKANGKDSLQFSFGKAGNVTITMKEEAGEMLVELVQDEIPTDEKGQMDYHIGCSKGWLFYLANLKSIAEGGIDLRNRNIELKDVISS